MDGEGLISPGRANVTSIDHGITTPPDDPSQNDQPAQPQAQIDLVEDERSDSLALESSKVHVSPESPFQERFKAVEEKMKLVDVMYDLHESTKSAKSHSNGFAPNAKYWIDESVRYEDHLDFYRDAMFFMSRIRESHQHLNRWEEIRKSKHQALIKAKKERAPETENTRQASLKAFLNGEPLKVMMADWVTFIFFKRESEDSILAPLEVVSGEPEPQEIIQLASVFNSKKKATSHVYRYLERVLPTGVDAESFKRQPLPERIRIHSQPLLWVFAKTFKGAPVSPAEDGSLVFLRPYQELQYHKATLREILDDFEKRFVNYDGSDSSLPPRSAVQGADDTGNTAAPPQSSNQPTASIREGEEVKDPTEATSRSGQEEDAEPSDPDNMSNSITTLLHLRCLLHFMDSEIKPKQEYINSQDCTHIHFHDLWFLFKPGDLVIDKEEKQVHVVLRVQNPRHKIEEPWERWNRRMGESSDSDSDSEGEEDESENPFTLFCAYIDFDGKMFGPITRKFKISPFGELKQIRSLPVYPLRFAKNTQSRQNIIERSKMLLDVAKFKAMYYMGVTLDKRDEIDSQVVIDFNEALSDEARKKWEPKIAPINTGPDHQEDDEPCIAKCCDMQSIRDGSATDTKMTQDFIRTLIPDTSLRAPSLILSPRSFEETSNYGGQLTETELLIMTYRVFGFVLRSRKWAQLDLTYLRYENSNVRNLTVHAFEKLELPEGHREMVKSLVVQHFRTKQSAFTKNEQTDLIQGKGKGLIMLLHGAPGVGKTTTAEGIAELFRKPLFQITCGDLGTTAKEVETELEKNFALASRWGCILLLDEADVFLSARERTDFTRNGLVAVFLRILEYYTGILFLTTNRIGDFDEAFASRIHMSLYYPPLNEDKTLKVFHLNLELIKQRFQKQERIIEFDESSVEDFARQHFHEHEYHRWNGRQIRNACQTALALAEYDAQDGALEIDSQIDRKAVVKLQLKYFRTVQRAYLDFGKYLGDIRGTQGDRRAIDYKLRARSDTPWQTRPSLLSQRGDSGSMSGHRGRPQHLQSQRSTSDMSQPVYSTQTETSQQTYRQDYPQDHRQEYRQEYRPSTPHANLPSTQVYDQHPPQPSRPQSYQGSTGNPGGSGHSNPYEQQEERHYASPDTRSLPVRQQSRSFDSPQAGYRQAQGGDVLVRPGLNYDNSPLAHRSSQSQKSHYSYRGRSQENDMRGSEVPMREAGNVTPRSMFRDNQGFEIPRGRDN